MNREILHTNAAPAPVGPYSQGVRAGHFIFTAGQVGLDPATGKMAEGLEAQAGQVMANLAAVLAAAGSSMDHIVKTTMFLTDMNHFATVNAIYGAAFTAAPPARTTVAVVGLPLGALVEIEAVALAA